MRATPGDTSWFVRDRFGLFIHWGLYALPARHEWVKTHEQISDEQYDMYFARFDPDLYDPDAWAEAAANAGMKYFVVTTKHHDGFCLWDSKLTDYKVSNTPFGKDPLSPMLEAFRARDIRVGLYHSLIDWHHPQFTIDKNHPLRDHPEVATLNEMRDQKKYIEYLHGQVRELLSDLCRIDVLWLDFSYPQSPAGKGAADWDSPRLYEMIRELQPDIILNDRMDMDEGWDVKTPEQYQPLRHLEVNGQPVVWEACHTFSGSWGYHRDEQSWKSIEQLLQMLIDTVSKGGNLLLNVGPTARGEFDARALNRLAGIGEWMKRHSRSIYGCTEAPEQFRIPRDCRLTYNPQKNRMYVHVLAWPMMHLALEGFAGKVEYAQLLNDASEIRVRGPQLAGTDFLPPDSQIIVLELPVKKPDVTVPVIELFMK